MQPLRKKRGFTLIEIVAVIIILIILAAIIIDRYGAVANGARNAVISKFFQDCETLRAKMYYGDSANGYAQNNHVSLSTYMAVTSLANSTADLDSTGNILTVNNLPTTLFSTHATTVTINYSTQTYDGMSKSIYLSHVQW